jgi:hypothetical protein
MKFTELKKTDKPNWKHFINQWTINIDGTDYGVWQSLQSYAKATKWNAYVFINNEWYKLPKDSVEFVK